MNVQTTALCMAPTSAAINHENNDEGLNRIICEAKEDSWKGTATCSNGTCRPVGFVSIKVNILHYHSEKRYGTLLPGYVSSYLGYTCFT